MGHRIRRSILMALTFQCSHCHSVIKAREELAGKKVRCSHCQSVVLVPLMAEAVDEPSSPVDATRITSRPASGARSQSARPAGAPSRAEADEENAWEES